MKTIYKILHSVVPCVLLTLCIGFCYAFSLFTPHIAKEIGASVSAVHFTFCLNIFFLGMGAATFGPLVEKHIKIATLVSAILLVTGLLVGGLSCHLRSMWLMYLGCGVLCGLAEGCGYVAPNKNMLLWFPTSNIKGIIMALSIFSFGLGSTVCAWIFGRLFTAVGISGMFYALAAIYSVPSFLSVLLIRKPKYAQIEISKRKDSGFKYVECAKNGFFGLSWMFMFLNISMGLILIGSCASILKSSGLSQSTVIMTMMACGISNGAGRLLFPAISDMLSNRLNIWMVIIAVELISLIPCMFFGWWIPFAIIFVNAAYGAAFATLPSILSSHYGKDTLSQRHGFCLTSWGIASLMAYLCTMFVVTRFDGFMPIMLLLLAGYSLNLAVVAALLKISKHQNSQS